jgi:hypothetical protein
MRSKYVLLTYPHTLSIELGLFTLELKNQLNEVYRVVSFFAFVGSEHIFIIMEIKQGAFFEDLDLSYFRMLNLYPSALLLQDPIKALRYVIRKVNLSSLKEDPNTEDFVVNINENTKDCFFWYDKQAL